MADSAVPRIRRRTSRVKLLLRIVTAASIVLYVLLWAWVRHVNYVSSLPVVVRLKPDADRAKLPVAVDSYPCFLVERAKGDFSASLVAGVRQ